MKKRIYLFLIVVFSSLAISACTDEEVSPAKNDTSAGGAGGGTSADKLPGQ